MLNKMIFGVERSFKGIGLRVDNNLKEFDFKLVGGQSGP